MDIGFIFTLVVSFAILYIGVITTYHDKKSATNKLFAFISLATVAWSFVNYFSLEPIFLPEIVWARLVIFFAVPHVVLFYFFVRNFPQIQLSISKIELYGISLVSVGMMVLTVTPFVFSGLHFAENGSIPLPGALMPLFGIFIVVMLLASIAQIIRKYTKAEPKEKTSWRFMLMGFVISYTFLIITNFILVNTRGDTRFILYAPLFMLPSILGTAFSILRYKLLNVKTIATEILIFVILSITLVQITLSQTTLQFTFNSILFCAFLVTGIFLVRSVIREVEQREKLYQLNIDLAYSIQQRESLVHLVTHKVKGSFTRTKYIFACILDGTFGEINPEVRKYAEQGLDSDNMGIETVDLVLNAANLEKGLIKYNMQKIDFKDVVLKSIEDKKGSAEKKGLKIINNITDGKYEINGDVFWLKEVCNNLIENSIKYTKEGEVRVGLENKGDKILFSVKDTGVGLTSEDKKVLFTEGGRGKDSVKVNVDSTGYGLYTVKLVVNEHKGRVWAESEGPGKGSQFYIELDAIK
ncbi:MAG: ATP-binding protein [Candidatus Paceibacterota bacterium]|jgi:signal transduction histidine kinase